MLGISEEKTVICSSTWGNLYSYDNAIDSYNYPFSFVSLPVVNITPRTNQSNFWLFTGKNESVNQTPTVSIVRPTQAEVKLLVWYHVIGRYK